MTMRQPDDTWITQVDILNFQSLKELSIKLIKGSNAFVGSSNSGKTATIRAIKWCLLNKPSGDDFITTGQKEAMVRVHLSNGKVIERRKGKGGSTVNLYRLYDGEDIVGEYTGFGTSVPEEIIEAHGIRPIAGDIYFQFADQLESAFLLSLKPSKRAEVLGNMEELRKIDNGLTDTNDDIRMNKKFLKELVGLSKKAAKDVKHLQLETDKSKFGIEALKGLKKGLEEKMNMEQQIETHIGKLEEIRVLMEKVAAQVARSKRIINEWPEDMENRALAFNTVKQHTDRLKELQEELKSIKFMKDDRLQELDSLKSSIEGQIIQYQQIKAAVNSLNDNQESEKRTLNSINERVAGLETQVIEKEIERYSVLFQQIDRLKEIDKSMIHTEEIVKLANEQIEKALHQFVKALQEEEICPTCGQDTHEVCPERIEAIV